MFQDYFIDSTLLNSQLIVLDKFICDADELDRNKDISIRLVTREGKERIIDNCHIDNSSKRRLRIPNDVMVWVRQTYPFSVAYFASNPESHGAGNWTKNMQDTFYKSIKSEVDKKSGLPIKMNVPRETLRLEWDGQNLIITEGFRITTENACSFLSEKAIASVLPYILNTVRNTSILDTKSEGKKCYIIDRTTDWISVKDYSEISFSHPGLYMLRRKTTDGEYAYYVGKAADIKNRIVKNGDKVSHPDEKGEDNKQYDEIACISVVFDSLKNLYGVLEDKNKTLEINPGVSRGSETDNALYAIEDIAIHVAAMILKSEGKKLDNKQYRTYTSEWLDNGIE